MGLMTGMAIEIANIVSQLFHLLLLLGVVCAPLPLVWHVLATHYLSSSTTPALDHMGLAALALWAIVESLVVTGLGLVGHLRLFELLLVEASLLMSGVWLVMRDRPKAASRLRHDIGFPDLREWRWIVGCSLSSAG